MLDNVQNERCHQSYFNFTHHHHHHRHNKRRQSASSCMQQMSFAIRCICSKCKYQFWVILLILYFTLPTLLILQFNPKPDPTTTNNVQAFTIRQQQKQQQRFRSQLVVSNTVTNTFLGKKFSHPLSVVLHSLKCNNNDQHISFNNNRYYYSIQSSTQRKYSRSTLFSKKIPKSSHHHNSKRISNNDVDDFLYKDHHYDETSKQLNVNTAQHYNGQRQQQKDKLNHHNNNKNNYQQHHEGDSTLTLPAVINMHQITNNNNHFRSKQWEEKEEQLELIKENQQLKKLVVELQERNIYLQNSLSHRIVLEQFEGEHYTFDNILSSSSTAASSSLSTTKDTSSRSVDNYNYDVESEYNDDETTMSLWCDDVTEDGQCPIEPSISFGEALRDRAHWLVGLLLLQSFSGIILSRNEVLLADHPFIIYFLTMLVGAGGNAGNQASVRVIRGLALGTLNEKTQNQFLIREVKMALALSIILSCAGFVRAILFKTPLAETIAVTTSLFLIVIISICLGAILPLILKKLRVDPAHSSTSIQVIMDILGVLLAVTVSSTLLDSPLGKLLISKLI